MKTIGLLGGMSWQSTIDYYRILNEEVARRLGGLHSAKLVMYSVDFSGIAEMQRRGEWDAAVRCWRKPRGIWSGRAPIWC